MTESGESRSTERHGADVGRALGIMIDALVVSPLETGLSAVRDPAAAIGRARQELRNARAIGSMVTNGGMSAFTATTGIRPPGRSASGSARGSTSSNGSRDPAEASSSDDLSSTTPPTRRRRAVEPSGRNRESVESDGHDDEAAESPDVDTLAVPDYDQLPAIDIVDQLGELTADERDAIEAYELAHRRRRTVLGKIAQLRSA